MRIAHANNVGERVIGNVTTLQSGRWSATPSPKSFTLKKMEMCF
jgi:hypothetical protein